jgi:hypothetical protein
MEFGPYPDTLEATLRRRGHRFTGAGDVRRVLFPEERIVEVLRTFRGTHGEDRFQEQIGPSVRERYHALFGQASFRKLARRLVPAHGTPVPLERLRENAGDRVGECVDFLEALGVAESTPSGVRCTRPLDNFGPSLAHHVVRVCVEPFSGFWSVMRSTTPRSSRHGVSRLPRSGPGASPPSCAERGAARAMACPCRPTVVGRTVAAGPPPAVGRDGA